MDSTRWLIPSSAKGGDSENIKWTALRSADQQKIAAQLEGAPTRPYYKCITGITYPSEFLAFDI
jgi:hypothetical protein